MKNVIDSLAEYVSDVQHADLQPVVLHECKRRLIDTIGCGIAGFNAEPSIIARKLAGRCAVADGATIIGTGEQTLPELATFANTVMTRCLDGNDCCPGGGGHPSDSIPAILAAAEVAKADGRIVLTAIAVAYELHEGFFRATHIFDKGLDHVLYTAISSAAGTAKVLGLTLEKTRHALSIATTANLALGATRRGELSMWKGCAGANAARNGVFAALAAREGITGPQSPLDGIHGLSELIGSFTLELPGRGQTAGILRTDLKQYATEYHTQSPIVAALKARQQLMQDGFTVFDIESVAIETYGFAYREIGSGAEKWRPQTRETADHSMPYTVAAVLIDGAFSGDIFASSRLFDPRILVLADKIIIQENSEFTRQGPGAFPCAVDIRVGSKNYSISLPNPRGHHDNPLSDDELMTKFAGMVGPSLSVQGAERAAEALWAMESVSDISELLSLLK